MFVVWAGSVCTKCIHERLSIPTRAVNCAILSHLRHSGTPMAHSIASCTVPCPPVAPLGHAIASLRLPRRVMALPWPCLAILGALLGFPGVAIAFPSCLPSAYRVTMSRFLSRLRPSWAFLPSLRILSPCRHSIGHLLGIPLHADQRLRVGFHGPLARLAYLLP